MEERRVERRTAARAVLEAALDTDDVEELRRIAVQAATQDGADVNTWRAEGAGEEPLLVVAAEGGLAETVQALLEAGAEVGHADIDGYTALYGAAVTGHVDVIKVLLEAGAEVDQASNEGQTALTSAAGTGHVEAVLALLEAGAEVGHVDNEGETALIVAALGGHVDVIRVLVL